MPPLSRSGPKRLSERDDLQFRFLDGLSVDDAKSRVIDRLEEMASGSREITYRLRDWGVSRQRYWGCPVPMIHCESHESCRSRS